MVWTWTFYWYVSPSGTCIRSDVPDAVEDTLLIHLRRQRTRPPTEWGLRQLKGKGLRDFYEHRFVVDDTEQRPFGFFGPGRMEYTIIAYATHKQKVYDPPGVFGTLGERRDHVRNYGGCKRVIKLD
jgi:hypothetical protein